MNWLRLASIILLLSPLTFGQKREYVELQRDVATLQDQVRGLERNFNEKMGGLTTLVQQTIDATNKLNTTLAVLDSTLREREKNLSSPVTNMGSRVDQLVQEFQAVRVSIEDMNARLGKLERGMVDMNNTLKVISTPATPPPAPTSSAGAPPQGLSAEALYANALRDKNSGNEDMALGEFTDYLKYYGKTDSAPNAQYYIGEINFNRKDYDGALKAFDTVLEVFSDNNKTLDAMFMKGRTLVLMGERTKGAEEFRAVIRKAPNSELAAKAKAQLTSLGLPVAPAKKAARKR